MAAETINVGHPVPAQRRQHADTCEPCGRSVAREDRRRLYRHLHLGADWTHRALLHIVDAIVGIGRHGLVVGQHHRGQHRRQPLHRPVQRRRHAARPRDGASREGRRERQKRHEEERVVPLCDEQHRHAACGIVERLEDHEADAAERVLALHRDQDHLERRLDHRALYRRAQPERRRGRSGHHRGWLDRDEILCRRLEHDASCRVELRLEGPLAGYADAGQVALVEGHHLLPQVIVGSGKP